jgi:hypothetical protein
VVEVLTMLFGALPDSDGLDRVPGTGP